MKLVVYPLIILACLYSCGSLKIAEGKKEPVYFTGSDEIFKDSLSPEQSLNYTEFPGLKGNLNESLELLQGNESMVLIHQPTLFYKENDMALIYPGDHIVVKGNYNDYTFSTVSNDPQREAELNVFKAFRKLEQYPSVPTLTEYTLETVLKLELEQKEKIAKAEARSQRVFDSLRTVCQVSNRFRDLTKDFITNKYDASLLWVYIIYRDTLKAHGLYNEKIRDLFPYFNNISDRSDFNANVRYYLNEVHSWLFQDNLLWSLPDEAAFKKCFDTIENNFTGLPRDYLLSRLMWRAYSKGLKLPSGYAREYRHYSIDKDFRKTVNRAKRERRISDKNRKGIKNNLLLPDGKTATTLEEVLAVYKGKFVLIDLWASWCMPCVKEMPYLKQLKEKYSGDKIVFIGISLDKQSQSWRKRMRTEGLDPTNNYLLLKADKTSFYKHLNINEIPRYMLIDPTGKIINDNAPLPSDPALGAMLDKLVF
jgi:thiol-disulfide isomerase/thioredoxin